MEQSYYNFPELFLYHEVQLNKCVKTTTADVIVSFIIAVVFLLILTFALDHCVKDALKR